ncbi:MAG TPA: asparagine synthase (glutamine-hydrolyzing) [Pyrinomonadaceae bacterium]|nr:asparagine synthase (glutamine-hydrolyzing) [Pyrinomonadaceae bacterium]
MCGISGVAATGDGAVARDLLEAMNERLRHRGPDDGGVWLGGAGDVRVGLAARRLCIIDLSARGHMPMASADGRLHITYNGEVYNFREIRRELEHLGHAFRSDTDTEVVLNAYAEWGPDCLHRLNGMFAFAVWDARGRELFVARDRLGVKPLHYAEWGGRFAFASEMKALMEDASLPREIDWEALDLYLTFRVIPHPYTIFKSVRKLAPGHYLVWKDGRLREHAYWDVFGRANGPKAGEPNGSNGNGRARRNGAGGVAAIKRELFDLVEDAVRMRLVSDVPLGVMLSGGIDSSVVAGLMARQAGARIKTFTLGFLGAKGALQGYDESASARRTAEFLGSEHHELLATAELVRDTIPEALDHCDEPFATSSVIPTFLVSKLARESVTVALSGDGPDEIFAGYRAYLLEPLADVYMRVPRLLRKGLFEPAVLGLPASDATPLARNIRRTQRFVRALDRVPSERFFRLTNKFYDVPAGSVYDPSFRTLSLELAERVLRDYYEESRLGGDLMNSMLYVDSKIKLADHILTKVDLMSMKVGLEVRSPFLDYRVVEAAFRIPGRLKINWFRKKHLLRETFRHVLPRHLLSLPKKGFEIPVSEWLKRELRETFLDTVAPPAGGGVLNEALIERLYSEHCQNRRDHSEKLWILFVLRRWARRNGIRL